jgi:type IV secretion/conjugal transfer VirB4 family ATPase
MQLTFAADAAATTAIGTALAGLFAFGGMVISVPAISQRIFPKPRETHLSDFLPFDGITSDGKTVMMKNGNCSRYFFIGGVDQTFMDYGEAKSAAFMRKGFLDGLADSHAKARIFTVRRELTIDDGYDYPNQTAEDVAKSWNAQFSKAYKTQNVICLTAKSTSKLDEAQQVLETTLNRFGVYPMTQNPLSNPGRLTIGEFLGHQCSPCSQPSPSGTGLNLSDALSGDAVWFRPDGIIEFSSGDRRRYASAIGIKKLGDDIDPSLSAELSSLQMEMITSRYVEPMPKAEALIKLEQHRKLAIASSMGGSVNDQFQAAMSMVESIDDKKSSLCSYSEVIMVFGDSIEEVQKNENSVRGIVASNGATAVREVGASQASWFLQFPTLDLLPRPYKLFSYNIAFAFTLDRPASGVENSDWGKGPIATFRTASNTLYQHNFHISDQPAALGHGVVVAPTGSGKTVLMEFLSLMSSRHRDVKHFFFDRYRGTAIYNLAMGGKYLSLNAEPLPWSIQGGMNPFDCEDTEENRQFLKVWLESITNTTSHSDIEEISDAVDLSFEELDRTERSLASIYEAAFSPGSAIKTELYQWVNPTQYGPIFNAEADAIDLTDSWLTAFDMTKLLDDPKLGAATVSYLMHRIRTSMLRDNSPGFIFIDETEPLLKDPNFLNLFKVALQEFRKIRGVVISVFQRPEALASSGVSQLVRQQSGTYYLFQNPGARAADYKEFELSEKETAFVLGQSSLAKKAKRSILIKRPLTQESVIVDVDLSLLGPQLKIFSSSSSDINLVSELYNQFEGNWIERYLSDDAP